MKKVSEEIFYPEESIVTANQSDIEFLKSQALNNKRKRSRLCTHKDVNDALHEMLIIHENDTYVRPHKHIGKSESFHIIVGTVDVIIFNEQGDIIKVVSLGEYKSGGAFYCRIAQEAYHTVIITSQTAVFHEVTNGPFKKNDCVFAPWAPSEENQEAVLEYSRDLIKRKESILKRLDSQKEKEVRP